MFSTACLFDLFIDFVHDIFQVRNLLSRFILALLFIFFIINLLYKLNVTFNN